MQQITVFPITHLAVKAGEGPYALHVVLSDEVKDIDKLLVVVNEIVASHLLHNCELHQGGRTFLTTPESVCCQDQWFLHLTHNVGL